MNRVHLHNKYDPATFRCADRVGLAIAGRDKLDVRYHSGLRSEFSDWMDQEDFKCLQLIKAEDITLEIREVVDVGLLSFCASGPRSKIDLKLGSTFDVHHVGKGEFSQKSFRAFDGVDVESQDTPVEEFTRITLNNKVILMGLSKHMKPITVNKGDTLEMQVRYKIGDKA